MGDNSRQLAILFPTKKKECFFSFMQQYQRKA
jgi:hypothetical protein